MTHDSWQTVLMWDWNFRRRVQRKVRGFYRFVWFDIHPSRVRPMNSQIGIACMLHTFQQLLKILNTTYQHLQVVSFMRLRRMLSEQLVQSVRLTKFDQNNCEKSIIRIWVSQIWWWLPFIAGCAENQLTELINLPPTLTVLGCSSNQLTNLTNLPTTLSMIDCANNKLTQLTDLPLSLVTLACANNQLT